jgi:lipopolysaccharide transport protein LptA
VLRIRLFKVLLPVLLIAVVALLIWAIRPQTQPQVPLGEDESTEARVLGGEMKEYTFGPSGELIESLSMTAESGEACGEQCYKACGVDRFKLAREGTEPLEISADCTTVTGPDGQRKMKFTGPVKITDRALGLVIDLPYLDVDELAGVGRSAGAVLIKGANHSTRAERLTYGLAGQATELYRLECTDDSGGLLLAERGFLHDGLNDIELVQGVRYRREDDTSFRAETSRLVRYEDGRLKHLTASGSVVAGFRNKEGLLEAAGDALEANWNDAGDATELIIDGRALLEQGPRLVSADRLEFHALDEPGSGWSIQAQGSVRLSGPVEDGTARLRAARVVAQLDADLNVIEAQAHGGVRFEGPKTQADAAEARLTRGDELLSGLRIELLSDGDQRARLAQANTRVSADRIEIDSGANSLFASGRVESTLLPQGDSGALQGLFSTGVAVHFISSELLGDQQGQKLTFRGGVRGWQGEKNLSAQEIVVNQEQRTLLARGRVTTRFPRKREGAAAGAEEFIQITAGELDYNESEYRGIYREDVRVVLAEGWIESDKLTVMQNRVASGFERLLAEGDVRLEFLGGPDDSGKPVARTTGHGDRLDYLPVEEVLWLYGDEQRAEIQRGGDQAGLSRGKVLTYRLDDGTLSVEGGSISTPAPTAPRTNGDTAKEKSQETPG